MKSLVSIVANLAAFIDPPLGGLPFERLAPWVPFSRAALVFASSALALQG